MLNHTYTSVKNANLVDCGKKTHIASQPSPLLKDNFLGEFRTELDKKKVLANLGVATDLSLEWEYIKGDIGRSAALMQELDSRTTYTTKVGKFKDTVISIIEGIQYLETVVGSEQEGEKDQNDRLSALEESATTLKGTLEELQSYLKNSIEIDIDKLREDLELVTQQVSDITSLIKVSTKKDNALVLLTQDDIAEGEEPGLYVPDLSEQVSDSSDKIKGLRDDVDGIQESLESFVTREELGGGDFNFVSQTEFGSYAKQAEQAINDINLELAKTVKTGEDGHVDTLYVNTISKNNNEESIKITDSFEVTSGIPLDVRCVVENLDELKALPVNVCYAGMGVIVNSLSSLYILRKPSDGDRLTQEYVSNVYNWKCPEDLVTVALSREQYEALEEKNPNVFYYIFEEEIKRTEEPKRDSFDTEEEYNNAFQDWLDSLKILSEEYMSASWGVGIEKKVSEKANKTDVTILQGSIESLQNQIDSINGGEGTTSLSSLAERVSETESDLLYLLGSESTEGEGENPETPSAKGKIAEIEESIDQLDAKVTNDYVAISDITDSNNQTNYIFVRKDDYERDVENRQNALETSITTETVNADTVNSTTINTSDITLSNLELKSQNNCLVFNGGTIAFQQDVPKIEYLSQEQYDEMVKTDRIDEETYYFTTDSESYVTQSMLQNKLKDINTSISAANKEITDQQTIISNLQTSIDGLLATINELNERLSALEGTTQPDQNIPDESQSEPDSGN